MVITNILTYGDCSKLKKAVSKTKHCRSGFKCLEPNAVHPRCSVDYAFGKDLMFVDSPAEADCPYGMGFGNGHICVCPTHYAIKTPSLSFDDDYKGGRAELPHEPPSPAEVGEDAPHTVSVAVAMLLKSLSPEAQAAITDMDAEEIGEATIGLGDYIRKAYGLETDNQALFRSCSDEAGCEISHPDDAAAIILARLIRVLSNPRVSR